MHLQCLEISLKSSYPLGKRVVKEEVARYLQAEELLFLGGEFFLGDKAFIEHFF